MQVNINREVTRTATAVCINSHAAIESIRHPGTTRSVGRRLLRQLRGQSHFLDVVADLNLVHDIHALDHAAENCVLTVQAWLWLETDVELTAARLTLRIYRIAETRRCDRAAQMLLRRTNLGRNVVTRTAAAVALGIAALDNKAGDHAMKGESIVETFLAQGFEVSDSFRCN